MTGDDYQHLKELLTEQLAGVKSDVKDLKDDVHELKKRSLVTWPALGTAVLIGVGIATLLLTVYGGQ